MKNFAEMMKQAQQLQGRMADMQAELERTMIEGRSGGGMVTVTLSVRVSDLAAFRAQRLTRGEARTRVVVREF